MDLDGLTGSGRLAGSIPVVRRAGALEIYNGRLQAAGDGGWIQYRGEVSATAAASGGQSSAVVFEVLENFHYSDLVVTVDGDTTRPVTVGIRLAGFNPDYLEGHPIDLNLNVESHLVDLLQKATAVHRIPAVIEERLRRISEGSTPQAPPDTLGTSDSEGEEGS